MLQSIVGVVDANSAAVLIAMAVCICVVVTTAIGRHRRRAEIANEFELAKIRLANERAGAEQQEDRRREFELAKLASEREVEFKRIDHNLITSHARTVSE